MACRKLWANISSHKHSSTLRNLFKIYSTFFWEIVKLNSNLNFNFNLSWIIPYSYLTHIHLPPTHPVVFVAVVDLKNEDGLKNKDNLRNEDKLKVKILICLQEIIACS